MTLEDRLNELETAIQTLRLDMQAKKPEHKFKVGDKVFIIGTIERIDDKDIELPYRVEVGSGEVDGDYCRWFAESELHPKAP